MPSAMNPVPGFSSGNYTLTPDLGNTTATTVQLTKSGSTYFFIVTAYNSAGAERPVSNQFGSPPFEIGCT